MKFKSLLGCIAVTLASTAHADPAKFSKEIAAFEQADREHPAEKGGIVFIGSSTIRKWKEIQSAFPGLPVVNRGFGGSKMEDSLFYAERILLPLQPAMVVVFAGSNDINSGQSAELVAGNFKAFVAKVRGLMPKTELRYIEITTSPSRWDQREIVIDANRRIREFCDATTGVKFIPVREKLLGSNGEPREELFESDRLHPNADGYRILATAIRPFLPAK